MEIKKNNLSKIKTTFDNAIFEYELKNEKIILELNDYINKKISGIYNFFGNDIKREIPIIHIISKKKELDKIYCERNEINEEVPNWVIGFAGDNDIYYLSLNDYKNTAHAFKEEDYENKLIFFKKTIVHEYIHFVNKLFNKKYNLPLTTKCLVEGIAQLLSGQNDDKKIVFDYSLDDILKTNNCYNGWYLVTKYIVENYSHDLIIELFKNKKKAEVFIINIYDDIKNYYASNRLK